MSEASLACNFSPGVDSYAYSQILSDPAAESPPPHDPCKALCLSCIAKVETCKCCKALI